jgi:hypothetical protein
MSVEDLSVQSIAQGFIDGAPGDLVKKLRGALGAAGEYREFNHGGSPNHVAAAHYLQMRYAAAVVGPVAHNLYVDMVGVYDDVLKRVDDLIISHGGESIIPRTGSHPASRFDKGVVLWAITGIRDGEFDFFRKFAGCPPRRVPDHPSPWGLM